METGAGLARAAAAMASIVRAHPDYSYVANMSYGEPSLQALESRFADLLASSVHDDGVVFVTSAGNAGPALGTVGAPGLFGDVVLSVGAYVSPSLAADAHSVRHAASVGGQYTWSSRGPVADGGVGVAVSAPGGAVSCVPTWSEQG